MFHYVNAITNTKGDALIGYFVKVVHPTTGEVMAMYADESSTPISSVSGVENACEVNADGNASFYVDDGEYHLDIYATDGATFVRRIEDVPMAKTGLLQAENITQVSTADTGYPVILTAEGREGIFLFLSGDKSVEVAADPENNNWIAPNSDITGASGAWKRISNDIAVADGVDTRVVSGLGIAYVDNLNFAMGAGTYYLDGVFHTAVEQTISLSAAHATLDRIDVLYLDSEGVLQKLTGTASASPSKPAVDQTTQLELTFVYVPAAATSLSGVTTEDIYQENVEWTTSQGGSDLTLASTNNPYAGTKCIEVVSTFATSSYLIFSRASNEAFGGDGNLIFRIRSKSTWGSKRYLLIQFYCDGVARGLSMAIRDGSFGFDSSVTSGYQTIVIGKSLFSIPSGTEIDALRITSVGSGNPGIAFYMDGVQLQTNGTTIGNSDLNQSIADARYVNVTGDTMTGDLVVPDEAYDATAWNGSLEVPTKNAIRDKIEALAPGGVISGALLPANNLSDVSSVSTSRTNLGLGSAATQASTVFAQVANNLSDLANASTARTNLGIAKLGTALPLTFNFTSSGAAYFYADEAMTLTQQATTGAGSVTYEKGTTAAPDTFSSTTSPISLQSGAWLKVTATAAVAVHLKRTA